MKYFIVRFKDGTHVAHGMNAKAVRQCYWADDPRAKIRKCPRWALKVYRARGVPFYEVFPMIVRGL